MSLMLQLLQLQINSAALALTWQLLRCDASSCTSAGTAPAATTLPVYSTPHSAERAETAAGSTSLQLLPRASHSQHAMVCEFDRLTALAGWEYTAPHSAGQREQQQNRSVQLLQSIS
jgi:hypothetical protein